jgi:hypothetical protein
VVKKYLVCAQFPYLVGSRPDSQLQQARAIEVAFPIEEYWKIEDMIKEIEYVKSNSESAYEQKKVTNALYRYCLSFTVQEKDRSWLQSILPKTNNV